MTALWIALIIAGFIGILFEIHIKVKLSFGTGSDNSIYVQYMFIKYKVLPKTIKEEAETLAEEEEGEKPKKKPDRDEVLTLVKAAYKDIKDGVFSLVGYVIKHAVTICELNISADYGFSDPMTTGIVTGLLNGAVYNIIGMLDRNARLQSRSINLIPDFENKKMKVGVYCVLATNIWHLLAIGAIAAKTVIKVLIIAWRNRDT